LVRESAKLDVTRKGEVEAARSRTAETRSKIANTTNKHTKKKKTPQTRDWVARGEKGNGRDPLKKDRRSQLARIWRASKDPKIMSPHSRDGKQWRRW